MGWLSIGTSLPAPLPAALPALSSGCAASVPSIGRPGHDARLWGASSYPIQVLLPGPWPASSRSRAVLRHYKLVARTGAAKPASGRTSCMPSPGRQRHVVLDQGVRANGTGKPAISPGSQGNIGGSDGLWGHLNLTRAQVAGRPLSVSWKRWPPPSPQRAREIPVWLGNGITRKKPR